MNIFRNEKLNSLNSALLFFGCILLFIALMISRKPWPYFSVIAVAGCLWVIAHEIKSYFDIPAIFDIKKLTRKSNFYLIAALLMGIGLGFAFRNSLSINLIPAKIGWFAIAAVLIGVTEEVIFRGYFQRKLQCFGVIFSIVIASAMHTFYKCFLFIVLPSVHPTDFFWLASLTFTVGCVSGIFKAATHNTIIPVTGHAAFDFISYSDGMIDTWWVWM